MNPRWIDGIPIYRQIRDRMADMILEGKVKEGGGLPSVRNVAAEFRINPLTVLKGYQQLVDELLIESHRGRGMYVCAGARANLLKDERKRFLETEWPRTKATLQRLGLEIGDLLTTVERMEKEYE